MKTADDLQKLDYPYKGSPFFRASASKEIDLNTLDYAYKGEPFWAIGDVVERTSISAYMYCHSRFVSAYLEGIPVFIKVAYSSYLEGNPGSVLHAFMHGSAIPIETEVNAYLDGNPGSIISGYIKGKLDDQVSIPGHLLGSINEITNISAYIYPIAIDQSNTPAFTNAVRILAETTTHAFLNGHEFLDSTLSAFVTSLQETKTSIKRAYLAGLNRSSLSAYIGTGKIEYRDFIWLITSDGSLAKKFKVLQQDYDDGTLEKSESAERTISGGIDHSVGGIYTTWSPIIRVAFEDSRPDFGTVSDLEYFYSLNNPKDTPSNTITFIDHRQYEHKVRFMGPLKKNLITIAVEGEDAVFLYRLKMIKVVKKD